MCEHLWTVCTYLEVFPYTRAYRENIRKWVTVFTTVHRLPACTNLSLDSAFLGATLQTDFALATQSAYSRRPVFATLTWYSGSCKCTSK